MSKFQKGDIYLNRFPFTSYKQFKIRPVVVLAEDKTYQDVVVMAISSVLQGWDPSSVVYILSGDFDFESTGLKKDSCVLVNRIATIREDRLFYHLGRLPTNHIQKIEKHFLDNLEIGCSEQKGGSFIPYGKQSIDTKDIYSVIEALRSEYITQGPKVPMFEQAVSNYCQASYAVAVNSATSALHLACMALDVGPGDVVWTSPITFVASANCARYCGADVDFVDIDPRTYNMSPTALKAKLEQADREGNLPKIVIPVHMCGQSCDMAAIQALAQNYGFSIIEDASHAIGGRYKGEPVGNCRYSDITVFSFHPVKIITTGEGGMAVTNREELAQRMALLRSHGITRDLTPSAQRRAQSLEREAQKKSSPAASNSMLHAPCSMPFYYEQIDLGYNYRMTDIQAALGLSQLQRLDQFVAKRQELARRYDRLLADLPVGTPWQHPDTYSAWHLYVIRLHLDNIDLSRKEVFDHMRDQGIGVNVHYIPVHTQPYYVSGERGAWSWEQTVGMEQVEGMEQGAGSREQEEEGQTQSAEHQAQSAKRTGPNAEHQAPCAMHQAQSPGKFPEAEKYYQEALTLPLFPDMTEEMQDKVCQTLHKILKTP